MTIAADTADRLKGQDMSASWGEIGLVLIFLLMPVILIKVYGHRKKQAQSADALERKHQ